MFKSKKKQEPKELEAVIGIVMTVYNGINEQSKEVFVSDDRKIFLSHLASLLESEAKLIDSPIQYVLSTEDKNAK